MSRIDGLTRGVAAHERCLTALRERLDILEAVIDRLLRCFDHGGKVYLLGNGGSAADAQHVAAELVGRFKKNRKPLPAVALTTDTSILTAVTNDLGADHVFERQVQALVTPGDVVWALSVSGTSSNVVRALEAARRIGAYLIGFTGRSGGAFMDLCDACFRADHDESDRVQEMHQLAYHLICEQIENHYVNKG